MSLRELVHSTGGVVGIGIEESLRAAALRMAEEDVGIVVVFDSTGMVGVLSERDLARAAADDVDFDLAPAKDYMTESPVFVTADGPIGEAIAKMNEYGMRHLPVVREGEVVGMISARDVLRLFGTRWPEL